MGLLKFLREEGNARKVFGSRELKIIEKQLLGVNLTQSEKNRLSRDIRKKFEFIAKAARFENESRLKKGAEIKRIIEETKGILMEDALSKGIEAIILYGSAAENKLHLGSDIDLAVKFKKISLKDATLFRKRISGRANSRADIQVFNILPEKIKKEINSKGKNIYAQDENKREDKRN